MSIEVLFFGILAEKAGKKRLELENISDVTALREYIYELYPDFRHLSFRISVNQSIAGDNTLLNNGDEVALLPPFAGG